MLRKDSVSNQGLEQISGTGSSETSGQHAPEPSATPVAGESTVESSPPNNFGATNGENRSRTEDLDPHICKDFPCPQCHPPRDTQQEDIRVAEQHSLRPVAGARSSVFRSDPEPQNMEQSPQESEDNSQLEVATGAQGKDHTDHCL